MPTVRLAELSPEIWEEIEERRLENEVLSKKRVVEDLVSGVHEGWAMIFRNYVTEKANEVELAILGSKFDPYIKDLPTAASEHFDYRLFHR